jgi:4-hydroxymandelate oxidase
MIELSRLEALAEEALDPVDFAYVSLAAGDSARRNLNGWQETRLRPQMLRDVSDTSTATTLLGHSCKTPIMVAPTAMHRLACELGELATAQAAADAEAVYVVSAQATTSIEEISSAAPNGTRWMQAYMMRDRGITRAMIDRAAASGCSAVVLTVDSPGIPHTVSWTSAPINRSLALPNLFPDLENPDVLEIATNYATDLTFDDLANIKSWTGLPLVVKGVLRGDDAVRCLESGADAVSVSNHGGRLTPDCVPTSIALVEVADAVGDRAEIYVDGGIRSGSDVLKALALGARAVMVGRPIWWGLAIDGRRGAFEVLETLRRDFERAMALCGVTDPTCVPRDLTTRVRSTGTP